MSNLPSLDISLEKFQAEVIALRQSTIVTRVRPHKLIMLLAVLDLAENGLLNENKIIFGTDLSNYFRRHFAEVAITNDSCRPGAPFFHLRSSAFWHHQIKIGYEKEYARIKRYESPSSLDTIAHATLENWAFEVVKSPVHRSRLRQFIMDVLTATNQTDDRLSLSFHRSFSLYRSGVAEVLQIANDGNLMSAKSIKESTTLGTSQVEAMPRYAERCGLLNIDKRPTTFGNLVLDNDPNLSHPDTQWAMHYFISAPHRYKPNFWNHLTTSCFGTGNIVDTNEIRNKVVDFSRGCGAKAPSESTLAATSSAFIGTYSREDSLGNLEILRDNGNKTFFIGEPKPPTAGVFACILADYWDATWGERRDALLSDVTAGPLASLLLLGSGQINTLLGELSERGLVQRQRRVPPFQVIRLWDNADAVWREHLYQ